MEDCRNKSEVGEALRECVLSYLLLIEALELVSQVGDRGVHAGPLLCASVAHLILHRVQLQRQRVQ